jgi:hypothetical protein
MNKNHVRPSLIILSMVSISIASVSAKTLKNSLDSRTARYAPAVAPGEGLRGTMEPKNLPDFAAGSRPSSQSSNRIDTDEEKRVGTALQGEVGATTVPVETKLRLVLECPVDAKTSKPGDIFEAHVKDDLFVGTSLLLPKGSFIRGRVVEVNRPRLISRAAKIGLRLEQIVTPVGEVIPLDAALEFRKGVTNQRGELDPGTSLGSRVHSSVRSVTGMNSKGTTRGALVAANIATLGAPAAATLIGSSVVGLFRSGDNVNLSPGQELEVLLTNDLGIQVNYVSGRLKPPLRAAPTSAVPMLPLVSRITASHGRAASSAASSHGPLCWPYAVCTASRRCLY